MKYALLFLMFFAVNLNAQVLDFEVIDDCLIDSSGTGEVRFKRVLVLNTGEIKDYTFDLTGEYTVVGKVNPCEDLELLDTECYEVRGDSTEYCDSNVLLPGLPQNPFDPSLSAEVDSVYIDDVFVALPNYPYVFESFGDDTQSIDINLLMSDIEDYLIANNIEYQQIDGTSLIQSTATITRTSYIIYRTSSTASSGGNSSGYNCTYTYDIGIYRVYRTQAGNVQIIIDDTGQTLQELPENAVKVECCTVCNTLAENACQVKNKTRSYVITNDIKVIPANTYHSIAIWHSQGAMTMTVGDSEPVVFLENRNFTSNDRSADKCIYKQSEYIIDTTQNGGGQVVIKLTY